MFDVPRRYLRNLRAFIVSKPPCVVFTLCLACLAVALFYLGYYVSNNEIVDPEAEKDWNDFLTGLSNIQFCIGKVQPETGNGIEKANPFNNTPSKPSEFTRFSPNDMQQISVPLKIGVNVWDKRHHLHGNITHLTALLDAPLFGYGTGNSKMNLTFSLSEIWNTERKCIGKDECKLPQGFFQSCVTIMAPRQVLPEWKPATCNSSAVISMTAMTPLSRSKQEKLCKSGAIIYFKHPIDLELREKLSVDERAKANLHLQLTSYFLFVLVISSVIYGMLKGKPVKSKKVTFESVGVL